MQKFCYRCGSLAKRDCPLIEGLCQKCFVEQNPLLHVPRELEVVTCRRCGSYFVDKKWHKPQETNVLAEASLKTLLSNIRVAKLTRDGIKWCTTEEATLLRLEAEPRIRGREGFVELAVEGKVSELEKDIRVEHYKVPMKVRLDTCDSCSLARSGYYEAIVQVRGKIPPEVKRRLQDLAANVNERDRSAFISEIHEKEEGLDFYVTSLSLGRKIGGILRKEFNAKVSESAKLAGVDKLGRKKSRVSILARIE